MNSVDRTDSQIVTVVDLGGTKAHAGQWELDPEGTPHKCVTAKVEIGGAGSLTQILQLLEPRLTHSLHATNWFGIAAAGVLDQGWIYRHERFAQPMNVGEAADHFGWDRNQVLRLNDTQAQTYWLKSPWENVLRKSRVIYRPRHILRPEGNQMFLAVGTGLGVGFLCEGKVIRSEGGHDDIPAASPFARHEEFLRFLEDQGGLRAKRLESILSGDGLAYLDRFLYGSSVDSRTVRGVLASHPNTVEAFNIYLGLAIRNFALTVMGVGGVWLFGGVLERNPEIVEPVAEADRYRDQLAHQALLSGMLFHDSRREVVEQVPVFRVLDKKAALKGILAAVLETRNGAVSA